MFAEYTLGLALYDIRPPGFFQVLNERPYFERRSGSAERKSDRAVPSSIPRTSGGLKYRSHRSLGGGILGDVTFCDFNAFSADHQETVKTTLGWDCGRFDTLSAIFDRIQETGQRLQVATA
jgi:hypothetical protein